jgi:enamine deaminase RidA (YjgF/YER057c/UK114 family)
MTRTGDDRLQHFQSGANLSQAVVHGGVVYLSGQVAEDGSTDAMSQTRAVLNSIDGHLAAVGTDRSHLLQVIVWLQDMADFDSMNEVWRTWLDGAAPPARATAQVALADADWRVEIIATAAIPN